MTAWWPFDETTCGPATTTANLVPTSPAGVHVNYPTPIPGKVFYALSFDGIDDHVRVPYGAGLDFGTGDFSVAGWIKTTQSDWNDTYVLVEKRLTDFGSYNGYQVYLSGGHLGLQLANSGWDGQNNFSDHSAFVADCAWHHFAVTVDRDQPAGIRFYVDGQPKGAFDPRRYPGSLSNSADLLIGSRYNQTGLFRGLLDEVQLFSRALSASEIQATFAAGSAGVCPPVCQVSIQCEPLVCGEFPPCGYHCRAVPTGCFGPISYDWRLGVPGPFTPAGNDPEITVSYTPGCPEGPFGIEVQVRDLYYPYTLSPIDSAELACNCPDSPTPYPLCYQ